jgi:transmembrane sensor
MSAIDTGRRSQRYFEIGQMFRSKPKTAAKWMVRISSGELSDRDRRDLEKWLAQKPENKRDLERSRQLWSLSAQLRNSPEARSLLERDQAFEGSKGWLVNGSLSRYLVPAAAVATVILVAFLTLPQIGQFFSFSRIATDGGATTARGEIASYTLPDGSTLTLGAASAARIAFNDKQRIVYLSGGEGFFDVKHNPDRPFIVVAGKKRVVVTGTKFNIDYFPEESAMEVAVVEGLVNVTFPAPNAGPKTMPIRQNEVVQFPANGSAVRRLMSAARASAWREGKLYFDDAQLSEALASMNRYFPKPLIVSSPEMGKRTVTGMFRAGDLNAVLVSLNDLYGLKGKELADRWLLIQDSKVARPN